MDCILHNTEGVDLMPANIELAGVENSLNGILSSETLLKEYIEVVEFRYDYVNSLSSSQGVRTLLKTICRERKKMNPKLTIKGILITMVDYCTNFAKEI
ncbi:ParA family protein [uncultured Robinsoniella sp.]|uniref:ParA family protein n=1 Tax=uncultured Robinsoniella sp. TaxID=904190 RepID=UPI00374EC84C